MRICCLLLILVVLVAIPSVHAGAMSASVEATRDHGSNQNATAYRVADDFRVSGGASTIDSTLFFDDFSAGTGNWTITTLGTTYCTWAMVDTLGQYTMPAESAPPILAAGRCWNVNGFVESANAVNCTYATNITLEWDEDYNAGNFFPNPGRGTVSISTDGGSSWSVLIVYDSQSRRSTHASLSLPVANVPALKVGFWAFFGTFNNGWWAIDNVKIKGDIVTEVGEAGSTVPTVFALLQNYPNPFNPSTTIRYSLPEQASVTLKVVNVLGQEVTTLVNDVQTASQYAVIWDGRNSSGSVVSTGIYFCQLTAIATSGKNTFRDMKRMLFVK